MSHARRRQRTRFPTDHHDVEFSVHEAATTDRLGPDHVRDSPSPPRVSDYRREGASRQLPDRRARHSLPPLKDSPHIVSEVYRRHLSGINDTDRSSKLRIGTNAMQSSVIAEAGLPLPGLRLPGRASRGPGRVLAVHLSGPAGVRDASQ